jgi:hypothetical protein
MLCEKLYAEIEEAEVCERSHQSREPHTKPDSGKVR